MKNEMPPGAIDAQNDFDLTARRLAALGHPARIRIINRLACSDACCCKDVVASTELAQSTVSQHLKVLVEAGLVTWQPDRQRSRYTLNRPALAAMRQNLDHLISHCCD